MIKNSLKFIGILILTCFTTAFLTACGSGDGGGGDDVENATITGTVAGTEIVALDENDNEVDRNTATGTPNIFTITVPVGSKYRFFLVENEGTINEEVFSLYQDSTNIFTISSAVTIDLGFVDTSTGVAIPTNNPLLVSGVTSGGKNTSIPSSLWDCQDDDVANGIYRICNYFPLDPNNKWNYTTGNRFISDDTRTCNSGYSGILYGTNKYEFSVYIQNGGYGFLYAGCDSDEGIVEDSGISVTFIRPQMQIGETVSTSIPPGITNQDGTTFDTTLIGVETITVPAGTFETLKIEILTDDIGVCSYKTTLWLGKEIGPIKIARTNADPADCLGCMFICDPNNDVDKLNTPAELNSATIGGTVY